MRAHPFADDNNNNNDNNSNNNSDEFEPELIPDVDVVDGDDLGPMDALVAPRLCAFDGSVYVAQGYHLCITIEELKALHDANAHLQLIKEPQGVDLGLPVLVRGVVSLTTLTPLLTRLSNRCKKKWRFSNKVTTRRNRWGIRRRIPRNAGQTRALLPAN